MKSLKVEVQGSGRHVHLSEEHFEALFGFGMEIVNVQDMGAGMFRAEQRVQLSGPKGSFESVAILGPFRNQTQVEISKTDARTLGIDPPIRMSGDLDNSAGAVLSGPNGRVVLFDGVIIAKRHAHLMPEDAKKLNLKTGDKALLYVGGERALLYDEVVVRVDDKNDQSEVHLDIDEINAAKLPNFCKGFLLNRKDTDIDTIGQSCISNEE